MKKFLAFVTAFTCLYGIAGCSEKEDNFLSKNSLSSEADINVQLDDKVYGAVSFDEAVKAHYEGIINNDVSRWYEVIPKGMYDMFPELEANTSNALEACRLLNPGEEKFYDGANELSYSTYQFEMDNSEDCRELISAMSKFKIDSIDNVWSVTANLNCENDTLIVESNDRYYSTYAMVFLLNTLNFNGIITEEDVEELRQGLLS